MRGNVKRRTAALTAVVLAMGGGLFIASQSEAGGSTGPKSYTVSSTPARISASNPAGSITLNNTSKNAIAFNAANITIPAGVTVSAVSVPLPAHAAIQDGIIQLRDLNTPKGSSVTVSFNISAPLQASCSNVGNLFVSDVRQSNDFNGQNNSFDLVGSDASFTNPCGKALTCTAGDTSDGSGCALGNLTSPNGNTATVTLNDDDTITGVITASFDIGVLTCPEYTASSDQLTFGLTSVTAGAATIGNFTKTVVFTETRPDSREDWQYQVCFEAPYDFPALLPSQLAADFAHNDFSGNTVAGSTASSHKGLLLRCSAGKGVPCIDSVAIDTGTNTVAITVKTPAMDPGMRL